MKKANKSKKIILATALCTMLTCSSLTAAGCSQSRTVSGEMCYEQYGTTYGIKVNVEVKSSSNGDRIKSVTIIDSEYVSITDDWEGKGNWDENLDKLLNAYRGQYVADILAKEVATAEGVPLTTEDNGFINYGDEFIITGATLGSSRLMLAVQNALKQLNN